MTSTSPWWKTGCAFGATAVAFGAFGAHGLKNRISDPAKIASWNTAAHYQVSASGLSRNDEFVIDEILQLIHSVALLIAEKAAPNNNLAKGLFAAGMTMFSGSIYVLILNGGPRVLGPVTPLGGLCMIGGWVALAFENNARLQLET